MGRQRKEETGRRGEREIERWGDQEKKTKTSCGIKMKIARRDDGFDTSGSYLSF
jgi:hypothetical protein